MPESLIDDCLHCSNRISWDVHLGWHHLTYAPDGHQAHPRSQAADRPRSLKPKLGQPIKDHCAVCNGMITLYTDPVEWLHDDRDLNDDHHTIPKSETAVCAVCETPIFYQDAPVTGGWWIHAVHPDDDHDAEPAARSNFDDVGDFHRKFNIRSVSHDGPGKIRWDADMLDFRVKFMEEELDEFNDAVADEDHAKMFDALIDLVYVAMGTAHLLGYPWQEGWDRVQEANMKKVRAAADGSDSVRKSSMDVVKPPGWSPPDIGGLLDDHGFFGK